MNLVLARHAQTAEQYKGRYIGRTDLPICETSFEQAGQLAKRLSAFQFGRLFCSPLLRCCQTAEIIAKQQGAEITIEPDLAEIDFGSWEAASFAEICERDPKRVEQWNEDVLGFTFPGGESTKNFYHRVRRVLTMIIECEEENVLVVSHGGAIRAMVCTLLGIGFEKYLLFNIKPARYAQLDVYGDAAVLSGFNL